MDFEAYPKIARLHRECIVTEKLDGTSGQIAIDLVAGTIQAGSRSRWLSEEADNFGFHKWVMEHREQLIAQLGEGRHFGEWWGGGINKRYPGAPRTFSLFNAGRWQPLVVSGTLTVCAVVPVLYTGPFDLDEINQAFGDLSISSVAWPPCTKPEGIIVYHTARGYLFKKTFEHDEKGKPE